MRGWFSKYDIRKHDGSPVDPRAVYFVLRLDADPHAQNAAWAYAESIEGENRVLALDIKRQILLHDLRKGGAK